MSIWELLAIINSNINMILIILFNIKKVIKLMRYFYYRLKCLFFRIVYRGKKYIDKIQQAADEYVAMKEKAKEKEER